jgi:hypothetical protein
LKVTAVDEQTKRWLWSEVGDSVTTRTLVDLGLLPPDWFAPSEEELAADYRMFDAMEQGECFEAFLRRNYT